MDKGVAIASGLAEQVGEKGGGRLKYTTNLPGHDEVKIVEENEIPNHKAGLDRIAELLTDSKVGVIKDRSEIDAVGHRTVHGGEEFSESVEITAEVHDAITRMVPLAPLHNPANLTGIDVAKEIFPSARQVAVFDTAFHQTMPAKAYRYAIPDKLYTEDNVRRYGFHGTSHRFVAKEAADYLGKSADEVNLITVHIGNGASIAAIEKGKSVDTSMGMTPLEGLVMGTRSGDLDPAIHHYLAAKKNMTIDEVNTLLNKESGIKGIVGINDMRDVEDKYAEGNDEKAKLGMEMYCYRIKKYIGAYYAALGHVDAIIFTAGVGENSDIVRELSCQGLDKLGITIDKEKNFPRGKGIREIQTNDSTVKVLVVPTNEELEIARQTVDVLNK
jgi:acetate kinase